MSEQLHLLRPFTQWYWKGRHLKTVEETEDYVFYVAEHGFNEFFTATTRFPTRHEELKGGSVYFCKSGECWFRMPFVGVEQDAPNAGRYNGRHVIKMLPQVIRTARHPRVGLVRGWRYATQDRVPPDINMESAYDPNLPPALNEHLGDMGIG